jgi:hypothetical protein
VFVLASGEGLDRLGALFERAAIRAGKPPEFIKRAPRMPHRAPLVITVAARARASSVVDLFEQRLTAGCAVMAMQMAAVAAWVWRRLALGLADVRPGPA